jgi:hypothetical protein
MILGLPPFPDDDAGFLSVVDRLVRGVVGLHLPQRFLVFRIDNWFGDRWLRFSGKALSALGVRNSSHVVVPPFVQNRITAQCCFERSGDAQYSYVGAGANIHHDGPSSQNLINRAKAQAPEAALFWFSGNSKANGRGSIMGYTPCPEKYWSWFLEYSRSPDWRLATQIDFHPSEMKLAQERLVVLIGIEGDPP